MGNSGVTFQPGAPGGGSGDASHISGSVGRTLEVPELKWAQGIAVNRAGNLVVTDYRGHQVLVVDSDTGRVLESFGSFGSTAGNLNRPDGVCIDPRTGNILVADSFNGRVQVFNSHGKPVGVVGRPGRGTNADVTKAGTSTAGGTLNDPKDVRITPDGFVLVTAENGLHVFDAEGAFVRRLTKRARNPSGIALDLRGGGSSSSAASSSPTTSPPSSPSPSGRLSSPSTESIGAGAWRCCVADLDSDRVQIFSSSGTLLKRIGGPGKAPGQLSNPGGVAVDGAGNIFVADFANKRIQMWLESGEAAGEVSLGFQPNFISIAADGTIFITGGGKIHVIASSVARAVPVPQMPSSVELGVGVGVSRSASRTSMTPSPSPSSVPKGPSPVDLKSELDRMTGERDALLTQIGRLQLERDQAMAEAAAARRELAEFRAHHQS